ncbi:MAG: hypothetical protein HY711_10520 [Candidatus Melainabacteria bacterium]|nr:hypothetical protein [Candidatus Melainabacteria bacterium]
MVAAVEPAGAASPVDRIRAAMDTLRQSTPTAEPAAVKPVDGASPVDRIRAAMDTLRQPTPTAEPAAAKLDVAVRPDAGSEPAQGGSVRQQSEGGVGAEDRLTQEGDAADRPARIQEELKDLSEDSMPQQGMDAKLRRQLQEEEDHWTRKQSRRPIKGASRASRASRAKGVGKGKGGRGGKHSDEFEE